MLTENDLDAMEARARDITTAIFFEKGREDVALLVAEVWRLRAVRLEARGNPSTWAHLQIVGQREHYGRLQEDTFLGEPIAVMDELLFDGSFKQYRYGAKAIFGCHPMTEQAVREHVARCLLGSRLERCQHYVEGALLPGRCGTCGSVQASHGEPKALPARIRKREDVELDEAILDNPCGECGERGDDCECESEEDGEDDTGK